MPGTRSRNTVLVRTPSQAQFHTSLKVADGLVQARLAKIVGNKPLTLELVPIRLIKGAFIPADCRRFISEYISTHQKWESGKPVGSTSDEYIEYQKLRADRYVPLPNGFGR